MSAITVDGDLVHYEVLGRGGRPVILVHGWIGSWRYWIPTMRQLQLKFRVYAIDLFGYGDSSKNPSRYTIQQQTLLLDEFMKQLGIPKTAILAHGLGAQVAIEFARQHQDRVARMLLANAPLFDPGDLDTRVPPGKRVQLTDNEARHRSQQSIPSSTLSEQNRAQSQQDQGGRGNDPASTGQNAQESAHQDETIPRRPPELDNLASNSAGDQTVPSANRETVTNPNVVNREQLRQAAAARGLPSEVTGSLQPDDANEETDIGANGSNPLRGRLNTNLETMLGRCFKRSEPEYDKLRTDLAKCDSNVIRYSVEAYEAGKTLDALRESNVPTVIVHGQEDSLIPVPTDAVWNYLTEGKEDELLAVPMSGTRHFPMLENENFQRLVGNFLETPDISKVELKGRWRRRSR